MDVGAPEVGLVAAAITGWQDLVWTAEYVAF